MPDATAGHPAEAIAAEALAWLAAEPERLGTFLAQTGAGPEALRRRIEDPEFLAFVLDHLLADEDSLLAFAHDRGVKPEAIVRARAALPGGDAPFWT